MTNVYDVGQDVRLTATFSAAPTAAIIQVKKPNGSILSYLSGGFASQGNWDAGANSPALADGTGTAGHYYTVTVEGTQAFGDEAISFEVGDRIYYNGKVWRLLKNVQATALAAPSAVVFYVDQYVTMQGTWVYGSDGVAVRAASEASFKVRAQQV